MSHSRHDVETPAAASRARGLYPVTPDVADTGALLALVEPVLPYATWLQYRNKAADASLRGEQARRLQDLCAAAGVPLIVNDSPSLAAAVGAAGVHLGEADAAIGAARALLGRDAIVGASCYDDPARARAAAAAGAGYLAFGALFPSTTKPNARRATPGLFQAAAVHGLPLVAIGGITPDNARIAIAAGADLVAVVGGVFDAPYPVAAARALQSLF